MKEKQDYIKDLAEIRSMMERSSKFLTLSGWAGIMAGIYAFAGAYIAYSVFNFNPMDITGTTASSEANISSSFNNIIILALAVLILTLGTAIILSYKKGVKKNESVWNAASKNLLSNLAIPLAAGGILIIIFISKGLFGFIMPLSLLFYGLALYNAGKFTYEEVKYLGIFEMALGLISVYFIGLGLILWTIGFGLVHIFYGIYVHLRYER